MTSKRNICKTTYITKSIDETTSLNLFERLSTELKWEEGIKSKYGPTRLAHSLDLDSEFGQEILMLITEILTNIKKQNKSLPDYTIYGVYLNYYQNGSMYTPNHTHPGTHQLVISLGGDRTLNVGKKSFKMKTGDSVLFGSAVHGVPKEDGASERISIATFMKPL